MYPLCSRKLPVSTRPAWKRFQNHGKMPSSQSQFHEPGTNAFAQNPTTQNSWGEMPFVAILKSLILQSLNLCFVSGVTGIMESVVKEVGMRLLRILAHMVSPNPTFLFLLDRFLAAASLVPPDNCCYPPWGENQFSKRWGREDGRTYICTSTPPSTSQCRPSHRWLES